jgi:hypothetical protein
MLYFFSALATACLRIFSALGDNVAAWIRLIPYGFEKSGFLGFTIDGLIDCCGDAGGEALLSLGDDGKLDQFVLDRLELDGFLPGNTELLSLFRDDLLECLLIDLVKLVALLKRDRTGDVVTEWMDASGSFGDSGDGREGIWTSFRTTIKERCKAFRANLLDTYSRAAVS